MIENSIQWEGGLSPIEPYRDIQHIKVAFLFIFIPLSYVKDGFPPFRWWVLFSSYVFELLLEKF